MDPFLELVHNLLSCEETVTQCHAHLDVLYYLLMKQTCDSFNLSGLPSPFKDIRYGDLIHVVSEFFHARELVLTVVEGKADTTPGCPPLADLITKS